MPNYRGLGMIQGLNAGLGMGMQMRQNKIDNERRDRIDQEDADYRGWQMGRAEKQGAINEEINKLNIERTQLGLKADKDNYRKSRVGRLYNVFTDLSTNADGSPRDDGEIIDDPRFTRLLNEDDEFRGLFGAGKFVNSDQPLAGFLDMSEVTGDGSHKGTYVPMLNRKDGKTAPLTEKRTDDPSDSAVPVTAQDAMNIIRSRFAQEGFSNKVSPGEYRARNQTIEDENRKGDNAVGLYRKQKEIDFEYGKKQTDYNLSLGLGQNGKPINGKGITKEKYDQFNETLFRAMISKYPIQTDSFSVDDMGNQKVDINRYFNGLPDEGKRAWLKAQQAGEFFMSDGMNPMTAAQRATSTAFAPQQSKQDGQAGLGAPQDVTQDDIDKVPEETIQQIENELSQVEAKYGKEEAMAVLEKLSVDDPIAFAALGRYIEDRERQASHSQDMAQFNDRMDSALTPNSPIGMYPGDTRAPTFTPEQRQAASRYFSR